MILGRVSFYRILLLTLIGSFIIFSCYYNAANAAFNVSDGRIAFPARSSFGK